MEDHMKIKCSNEGVRALVITVDGKRCEATFDKGIASVDAETGEALVAAYPDIMEVVKKTARKSSTRKE